MFSEIIKLIPSVDPTALRKMFATLNQRFAAVAKKFGEGIKNAFKFTGGLAIIGTLLSKLLNPLQKAEEIIDRILNKGDDAVTNAEEFGTDPGKLLRLEAVAASKGVDSETLRQLLGKFQGKLAEEQEAAKDPTKKAGLLREFVGEKDTADAFFKFIQSIQGLDKSRQVVVQSEIFGEKVRGKASEFFNAKDFADILAKLPSSALLGDAAKKSGALADEKDLRTAIRDSEDFVRKSGLVKESQIEAIDQSKRQDLRGEDESLKRFDSLKSSSIAIQELTHKFDSFATTVMSDLAPKLVEGVSSLSTTLTALMPILTEAKDLAVIGFDKTISAIATASNAIGTYWAEFKSSRVYKFFGGN